MGYQVPAIMQIPGKGLLFASLLLCLAIGCKKDDPPVFVDIPDDNFLAALIELGVDKNGDGEIFPCEAEEINSLDVSEKEIADMSGIEAFINLDSLNCRQNAIRSLDLSKNTALKFLVCLGNEITNLEVSNCTDLELLACADNPLGSLDLSNNISLDTLSCGWCQLLALDVSHNVELKCLYLTMNLISELDLSNNTELEELGCASNHSLPTVDISNNLKLRDLR